MNRPHYGNVFNFEYYKKKSLKENGSDGNEYFKLSYDEINQINKLYDTNN